ncbi:hypothetical protein J6590_009541 [Homalodisca vitripennis]|nr:hypothetical protein J6590_009541 [Homalodisca vitripennis]
MSDNIVNHPSELDRQLDVDLSDDDWSDVSSIFSDDTDVDPTYRPTISDSDDKEMPFSQLSTSRGNAAARPTPDNDQPASDQPSDLSPAAYYAKRTSRLIYRRRRTMRKGPAV